MLPSRRRRNVSDYDHISDAEIVQDIEDTAAEIYVLEREINGLEMLTDRWSHIRAQARRAGVQERREFIAKLQAILAERGPLPPADYDPTPWCHVCGAKT